VLHNLFDWYGLQVNSYLILHLTVQYFIVNSLEEFLHRLTFMHMASSAFQS
jgi:hypothetical protein